MTKRRWRYTAAANADVDGILDEAFRPFGAAQTMRHAQLIDHAMCYAELFHGAVGLASQDGHRRL